MIAVVAPGNRLYASFAVLYLSPFHRLASVNREKCAEAEQGNTCDERIIRPANLTGACENALSNITNDLIPSLYVPERQLQLSRT